MLLWLLQLLLFTTRQDGSVWLFTTEKFEGSRPYTIQANYEGFAEGKFMCEVLGILLAFTVMFGLSSCNPYKATVMSRHSCG